jgi:hypothetical protein
MVHLVSIDEALEVTLRLTFTFVDCGGGCLVVSLFRADFLVLVAISRMCINKNHGGKICTSNNDNCIIYSTTYLSFF